MIVHEKALELISLEGRVAVISGAASGIGLATANLFADVGAAVVLLDINDIAGRKATEEIKSRGGKATFHLCDVTISKDCERAAEATWNEFGKIDILFNNAGLIRRKSVVDLSEAEWDLTLDVSLKGIYQLSHRVIPYMIKGGGGSIINTGSGWSLRGGPNAASYCAAKGGVLNLTRAMAIDHGKDGIRVNCVCPGDIDTPMLRGEAEQLGVDQVEFMKEAADRPLGRVGVPEDVAKAVLFFACEMSSWVTGSFLVVDGGGLA